MSLIEYQTAYSGMNTHSMLKKTRYTHIYMKLLPSRLMLPVSHSGQKVMKPRVVLISIISHLSEERLYIDRTSVELTSRQDNHPDAGLGTSLCNQVADVHRQGSIKEDGQKLETDDTLYYALVDKEITSIAVAFQHETHQISSRPSLIRPRIHHPQLRKRIVPATLRSIHPAIPPSEIIVRRGHQVLARFGRGNKRVEAVVQEAALEDEVAERVGEVPDEEEAQRGGSGAGEDEARRGVSDEDDSEGREEGDDCGLVEEVGGEGRGHFCCFVLGVCSVGVVRFFEKTWGFISTEDGTRLMLMLMLTTLMRNQKEVLERVQLKRLNYIPADIKPMNQSHK